MKRLRQIVPITEIVAYHGTNKSFDKFELSKGGNQQDRPGMIFFTPNKKYAAGYGKVRTVTLDIKNPYEVSHDQRQDDWARVPSVAELKRMGHDGIKVLRDKDHPDQDERGNDLYIPFDSQQIKNRRK